MSLLTDGLSGGAQNFVQVEGIRFIRNGQPYHFIGTNFWYGMHLADEVSGDRARLLRELDRLQALGVNNLRILAGSLGPDQEPWRVLPALQEEPGIYRETLLEGLDFLLVEMQKRDMVGVLCLNNFWPWSGGMAQYVAWSQGEAIPYPPSAEGGSWIRYMRFSSRFYKDKRAQALFENHIKRLLSRVNTITGIPYTEDPTIMSWQLANEPRGMFHAGAYRRWIRRTAALIKSLDPNHLVSLGSEGNTSTPTGNHFWQDHRFSEIDYTTIHIWIQNWGWYDPLNPEGSFEKAWAKASDYLETHEAISRKLNKPMVLEEFGIARDLDDHRPDAPVIWRERYYRLIFERVLERAQNGGALVGCNFWAWAGEGRPAAPRAIWKPGDDLIGDPPHEYQGWYSVYDKETETTDLIREFNAALQHLQR